MMGRSGGTTKRKGDGKEVKKSDEKSGCNETQPSNDVNKASRSAKRNATPVKRRKKETSETNKTSFREDNDYVTIQVDGLDGEFEEGEIEEGVELIECCATNKNASATMVRDKDAGIPSVSELETEVATMSMQARNKANNNDDEDLQVVTKKIAGETFTLVKEMMEKSGIFDAASLVKDQLNKLMNEGNNVGKCLIGNSQFSQTDDTGSQLSETTVYENTVRDNTKKKETNRGSTFSEEGLDTSDETNFAGEETANLLNQLLISDIFPDEVRGGRVEEPIPLTSSGVTGLQPPKPMVKVLEGHYKSQLRLTPEEKAERLIREAEAAKAHV